MAIGIGIGIPFRRVQSGIPFKSDLSMRILNRSGLTLVDEFGNNGAIIPSCGKIDGNNYLIKSISNFASDDSSGYIECKFYMADIAGALRILFSTMDQASNANYLTVYTTSGKLSLSIRSSVGTIFNNSIRTTNNLTIGWNVVRIISTGTSYQFLINGNLEPITVLSGLNDGKWLNLVSNRDNIAIGTNQYTSRDQSALYYNVYVDYNNRHKWIITGYGNSVFDSIGSEHFTWFGTSHIYYDSNASQELMDNGYSLWQKSGSVDEYVPYKNGLPNDVSAFLTGYSKTSDHAGDLSYFNLAQSLVNIPNASWDRSNTTIYNATARTGFYDVSNPNRWHSSELNRNRFNAFTNLFYQGLSFPNIQNNSVTDRLKLLELFSYSTNKIRSDLKKVLTYTNDQNSYNPYVCAIGDSTIADYSGQNSILTQMKTIRELNEYTLAVPGDTIADQLTDWNNLTTQTKDSFDYVFIQVGLNDLNPAESAQTTLIRYQNLVNAIISTINVYCKVYACTMTPCKERLTDLYGATNGLIAYQKWLDMNEAFKGLGSYAITGTYGYVYEHTDLLNDGNGNLKPEYEIPALNDHIHENNAARLIIAQKWAEKITF